MDKTAWLELLLAGFFAIGSIRSCGQFESGVKMRLVLRIQHKLPPAVEIMAGVMFLIFIVFPVQALVREMR